MWTRMRAWLAQAALPDSDRLRDDLPGRPIPSADDTRVQLERKPDMKRRGLPSPDWADALACTFAEAVGPRAMPAWLSRTRSRRWRRPLWRTWLTERKIQDFTKPWPDRPGLLLPAPADSSPWPAALQAPSFMEVPRCAARPPFPPRPSGKPETA
jgi:hypothetical protein